MSLRRAIRPLEQSSAPHSRVQGWAGPPRYDELCIRVSLACVACMTAARSRLQALGRMAVSKLKIMHFSLCKIAQSEPSRGGAGTWRRQVQSKAAPRCRRIRVQHESTWTRNGDQWSGRTCRPRATRWSDGPASQARHHGRPASASVRTRTCAKRRTELNDQAHNIAQRPTEQGTRRDA